MAYDVDRKPGTWVRAQTARRERRIRVGLAAGFLATCAFLALALGRHVTTAGSLVFLAAGALVRPYAERYVEQHVRMRSGTRVEVAVGETLEQLRSEGWIVMHDLERSGHANVDHLVSGWPNGVYAIETKASRYEDWHLGRIMQQALWLHDELGTFVTPVVCLGSRRRRPFKARGVWVVPHAQLLAWLSAQRNQTVDFDRLARFADTL